MFGFDILTAGDGQEDMNQLGKDVGLALLKDCKSTNTAFFKLNQTKKHREKADELYSSNKYEEALIEYNLAIASNIDLNTNVFNNRGHCKYQQGDYYGALADYQFAILTDSLNAAAYNNIALTKFKLGRAQDALNDYNKAISLDSTNANFYSNRGILYYENDVYDDAEKDLKKALKLRKEGDKTVSAEHYYLALNKQSKDGNTVEVETYLNRAIELAPDNGLYLNVRGLYYWDKENLSKAKADFLKAIEKNKSYNPAYFNYAQLLYDEKHYAQSEKYLDSAITIASDWGIYYSLKGKILYEKKESKKAFEMFDKSIETDPQIVSLYETRASYFEKIQNYDKGIDDYSKAIELSNQNGHAYHQRGLLYLKKNKKAEACENFYLGKLFKNAEAEKSYKTNCK
ncbi:tetratricopeptide repeat protein [Pseudarcicella hirudinis]|nr:tetratricopeptide repeat protein [Pseudarcicella hirudinis]